MRRTARLMLLLVASLLCMAAFKFEGSGATASAQTFNPQLPRSDDFNAFAINSIVWRTVNPFKTGNFRLRTTNTTDALLEIGVPAGIDQQILYRGIEVPRLTQRMPDIDFNVEIKFESGLSARGQSQGVVVEQDGGNYIRFDFALDQSGQTLIARALSSTNYKIDPAKPQYEELVDTNTATAPLWMRIKREGVKWSLTFSIDGQTWSAEKPFNQRLRVGNIGLYASSAGIVPNRAKPFTAYIDYIHNLANPDFADDRKQSVDNVPVTLQNLQTLTTDRVSTIQWESSRPALSTLQFGKTLTYELGKFEQTERAVNHKQTVENLEPNTTYNYRITSTTAAGQAITSENYTFTTKSAPPAPPKINIWYGDTQYVGELGISQAMVEILGSITVDGDDNAAKLAYNVNGGDDRLLSIGPDDRRLAGKGDFTAEIPLETLQAGENIIVIKAEDKFGNRANTSVKLIYSQGNFWPLPFAIRWGEVRRIDNVAQVVNGRWQIDSAGIRTLEAGFNRMVILGDASWQDYEVAGTITVHDILPVSRQLFALLPEPQPAVGVMLHWNGYYAWDDSQPMVGWTPAGGYGRYSWNNVNPTTKVVTNEGLQLLDSSYNSTATDAVQTRLALKTPYQFRMRVLNLPNDQVFYAFKLWPTVQAEPPWWNLAKTVPSTLTAGSVALVANRADATFGDIAVNRLEPDAYDLEKYLVTAPTCVIIAADSGATLRTRPSDTAPISRIESPGAQLTVNGQATDIDGNVWLRIAADNNWVLQNQITAKTSCANVITILKP